MGRLKIQVIGDSLSLHRELEGIPYEKTYPGLMGKWADVTLSSKYSNTSDKMNAVISGMDYVVIHLGLVDCFPRVYAKDTKKVLFYLPPQLRNIVTFFHRRYRYFFTRMFPKVEVEASDFEKNIIDLVKRVKDSGAKPIIIDIVHVSPQVALRNYGVYENIRKYNSALQRISYYYDCEFIGLNSLTNKIPENMHTDGQHLSIVGHSCLHFILKNNIGVDGDE